MARKSKVGLDYFPHNCNYDDELKYIIALHKELGYYVYFESLKRIYSDLGYYMSSDKKVLTLLSNEINISVDSINDVIRDCLDEQLFDKKLYKDYNILTSKGIQERYFEAIKRRNSVEIIDVYILADYVNILTDNVDINLLNVNKSTQSKVKKSKVKESKEIPELPEFLEYSKTLGIYHESFDFQIEAKYNAWVSDGWCDGNGNKIKNWKTKIQNTMPHFRRTNHKSSGSKLLGDMV